MSISRTDKLLSYALSLIILVIIALVGYLLMNDYARAEDFLVYRLAFNLSEGNGLVYNADEYAIPTISPLMPALLALGTQIVNQFGNFTPDLTHYLATGLVAIVYGLGASALYRILRHSALSRQDSGLVIAAWLLTAPVWIGLRSPAPLTLTLILFALETGESNRWRQAGILAGLAILAQPEGALGAMALGIYALAKSSNWRYWQTVWIPGVVWGIIATIYYTDGWLGRLATEGSTGESLLWISLFLIAAGILYYTQAPNWLWVLGLWGASEVIVRLLVYGEQAPIESLPLALTIAAGLVIGSKTLLAQQRLIGIGASLLALAACLVIWSPQTASNVQHDRDLGESLLLPASGNLLHDRGDAITGNMRDFDGSVYRLDGKRSPWVADFVERGDYQSLIIATAPRYIYLNGNNYPQVDLRSDTLQALDYHKEIDVLLDPGQREGDEMWVRRATIGSFGDSQTIDLTFSPDVRLESYALDQTRLQPGQPLRIRLDWQLERPPTAEITALISLLDANRNAIMSIFPVFPAQVWESLELSTYHVLTVPEDAEPGLVSLEIALDYKAAVIGKNTVGSLVIALPQPDEIPDEALDQIANVLLYSANVTPVESGLQVDLMWGLESTLSQDYQVLVHLIPVDAQAPAAFGDGPPLNGRYPTSYWQAGDVIPDTHFIALNDVPPGDYQIFVGFYLLETFERLRDDRHDSINIAQVSIDNEGNIVIN